MIVDKSQGVRPGTMPAPRNHWYVAAFADEVTEKPMARFLLNERVLFYRTSAGVAVALADYCAHRAMALSKGTRVDGDRIQCPYHGIQFGPDGICRHVPSQKVAPRHMRVRAYPLAQRWQWLWIWMGDPDLADEKLIPDHSDFGFAADSGYWKVKLWRMDFACNFQVIHENLLDVSHVTFLHAGMVDNGSLATTPPRTVVEGNVITVTRRWPDVMSGSYAQTFGMAEGTRVIRTNIAKTYVPGLNVSMNMFEFPDEPDRPSAILSAPMACTPETDLSCHYFMTLGASYGEEPVGAALEARAKALWDLILTDKEATESIQEAYNMLGAMTPDCSVKSDEAAVRYRRMLAQQIMDEQQPAQNKSVPSAAATGFSAVSPDPSLR